MYVQNALNPWWSPFPTSFNSSVYQPYGFFGPPIGNSNMGGLSSFCLGMPGGMYNGGMLGQAMGSTIGYGSWGSPEVMWAYMMEQMQHTAPSGQNGSLYGCNPYWNEFQGGLQDDCCCCCESPRPEPDEKAELRRMRRQLDRLRRRHSECQTESPGCGQEPPANEAPACGTGTGTGPQETPAPPSGGSDEAPACGTGSGTEPQETPAPPSDGANEAPACGTGSGTEPEETSANEAPATAPEPQETPATEPTTETQPTTSCEPWQPAPGQDLAWASQALSENFDLLDTASGEGRDGLVSREDLESLLANNPDAPQELRDACQLMLRNESYFNATDAAQGGTPDGLISRDDANRANEKFTAIEQRPPQDQFTPAGTAEVLERYTPLLDTAGGGEADGIFGREDLQRVLDDPDAPQELKQAARQTLENGYLFNAFDDGKNNRGELDGKISLDDLKAARERLQAIPCEPAEGQMTEAQAARTLDRYMPLVDYAAGQGGKDEKIGRADLEALAASPDLPPDLRQAVDLLMSNPAYFNHFDQAGDSNGDLDGEIGRKGLEVLSGQC